MRELAGRVALVTGASRGIGRRLALELARHGAHVVVTARDVGALELVAGEAEAAGVEALVVPADLTDADDRRGLLDEALCAFGRVDVLVNNAGILRAVAFGDEDPTRLYATNVLAPFALTRLVLPGMVERGEGHVLTVASIAGLVGLPHLANYSASQAALVTFSHALRLELRGSGVSATVVHAGFVRDADADVPSTTPVPWYLGTTTIDRVARRAVDALRHDRVDTVVNPRPVRPLAVLRTAGPRMAQALLARLGLPELTAAAAAEHRPYTPYSS